jgi:hypothetical protein
MSKGRFGKKAQAFHIDRQDLLAAEFLDADMLVGQFRQGVVSGPRGKRSFATGYLSGRLFVLDGGPVLG